MTAAEAYAERTRAQVAAYAPWLDREDSRRALAEQGLPEPRCEAWRYSNPNRWYEAQARPASRTADPVQATGAEVVEFEAAGPAQRACIERHLHSAIDRVRHPLATVNDIAMCLGLLVRVPESAEPAEIALGELGGGVERVLVVVEPNAAATLVERPATPAHRVVECVLGQGATLRHVRLQPPSESVEYHLVAAHLSDGSTYRLAQYSQGATLRRNDLHVAIRGSDAEVDVRCAYRLAPGTHLDTQVGLDHEAPRCVSRQTARGVVGARARAVLNGRIHVAPGAQRSDAALTTKTLLLAPTAEINAKPELTIYADDVQCAHGATVGELDADALFYLRSRGVDATRARDLLVAGFLAEAIAEPCGIDARALLGIAR